MDTYPNMTAIVPLSYGPYVKNFPRPSNKAGLGSAGYAYMIVGGGEDNKGIHPPVALSEIIDVRDVAKAHVLALDAPKLTDGRKKRLILSAGHFTQAQAIEAVKKFRPELVDRLPKGDLPLQTVAKLDASLTAEVLGLKEYIKGETAFLEALDACLKWERGEPF